MPADKYADIFNGKVDAIGNNPGHGFANVTVKPEGITGTFRMNLPYEVQCFKAQTLNEISNNDKSLPFQAALRKNSILMLIHRNMENTSKIFDISKRAE